MITILNDNNLVVIVHHSYGDHLVAIIPVVIPVIIIFPMASMGPSSFLGSVTKGYSSL